ncbi:hypothetical protein Gogos_022361, partial [Gossypium gossypioides]|nr:hypothetical protein [Gossypium gossypioides]
MKKAGIQILFLSSMFLVVVALPIKLPIMPRVTVSLVPSPFLSSNTPDVGNENGNGIGSSQGDGNGTENGAGEGENRHRP